jgi:predicted double-glycine peptidase
MKLMTTVQQEINGCGIAAVATIVQKPYSKLLAVANSLGIFASDEWLFSNT